MLTIKLAFTWISLQPGRAVSVAVVLFTDRLFSVVWAQDHVNRREVSLVAYIAHTEFSTPSLALEVSCVCVCVCVCI